MVRLDRTDIAFTATAFTLVPFGLGCKKVNKKGVLKKLFLD
jgi:hypothetical protein